MGRVLSNSIFEQGMPNTIPAFFKFVRRSEINFFILDIITGSLKQSFQSVGPQLQRCFIVKPLYQCAMIFSELVQKIKKQPPYEMPVTRQNIFKNNTFGFFYYSAPRLVYGIDFVILKKMLLARLTPRDRRS